MEGYKRNSEQQSTGGVFSAQALESLEKLRTKLLDLTTRNRLLNYKEGVRSIRLNDEPPGEVFRLLVSEGKSMELVPFVETEEPANQDRQIPRNSKQGKVQLIPLPGLIDGRSGGTPTAHEPSWLGQPLKESVSKFSKSSLQTQLTPDVLERRCKKILQESRTAIEESGSNMFHLAIGFLEWFDDVNSGEMRRAPLILIPAKIERGRLDKKTDCYSYIVSYTTEDIETNLSLAVKLDQDFNLILPVLPELNEKIIPEEYLMNVERVVRGIPRWRVAQDMVFGMFAFAKILMYKAMTANDGWIIFSK